MALKFLFATVTQGSADAFAETEFSTGLSNVTRSAFRVRRVEFFIPNLISAADCSLSMSLRRSSSASIELRAGNPMICGIQRAWDLTTSGGLLSDQMSPGTVFTYAKDEELLIVEEQLYLQIDSTNTSAANVGAVRIGYEVRQITENERLQIQAQTAQG